MFVGLLLGSLMVSALQCVGGWVFKRGRKAEDSGTVEDQAGSEAFLISPVTLPSALWEAVVQQQLLLLVAHIKHQW